MEVDLVDFESSSTSGKVLLKSDIFDIGYDSKILSLVVNWQLARKRSGIHKAKTISEISGTTRKPHKQKGTGRARQGSLRSPQFRGGAVIFGPVVRSHAFKVNKKVRKLSIKMALSLKCANRSLFLLKSANFPKSKTTDFVNWLNNHNDLSSDNSLLIISDNNDKNLSLAIRNLHKVKYLNQCAINVYDLLKYHYVLMDQNSIPSLENRYLL